MAFTPFFSRTPLPKPINHLFIIGRMYDIMRVLMFISWIILIYTFGPRYVYVFLLFCRIASRGQGILSGVTSC